MEIKMSLNVEKETWLGTSAVLYTALTHRFTERSRARFNVILRNRVSCDSLNLTGLEQALFSRGLNGLNALSHSFHVEEESMERVEPVKWCIRPNPFFISANRIQWCFLNAENLRE